MTTPDARMTATHHDTQSWAIFRIAALSGLGSTNAAAHAAERTAPAASNVRKAERSGRVPDVSGWRRQTFNERQTCLATTPRLITTHHLDARH